MARISPVGVVPRDALDARDVGVVLNHHTAERRGSSTRRGPVGAGWLIDLIFPPRCVGCRRRGTWLCPGCRAAVDRLPTSRCRHCAEPHVGAAICADCWRDPPAFRSVRCNLGFDGAVRRGILQLKYQGARHLAPLLVDLALESDPIGPIGAPLADLSGAVIVPVPLHPRRLAERGYNQSAVLAAELGRRLGAAVRPSVLARVRDTRPQQELPRPLRQANVRGAFSVAGPPLLGQSVILVDDVCTTASTLREAAKALRAAGASTVDAFVIARAYHARHPALPPPAH